MRRLQSRNKNWLRLFGAIAGLLIVAVGLCILHFDHHAVANNGTCPDPCSMMISTLVLVLLAAPLVASFLVVQRPSSVYALSLTLLDPPPKSLAMA